MDEFNKPLPKSTIVPDEERRYYMFALKIVGDFGAAIAVPVAILSYLGKRLDARFNSDPYLLITGFVLAAVFSGFIIFKKTKQYGKQYEAMTKQSKKP